MSERVHPANPLLLVDDEAAWTRSFATALRYVGINNILTCNDPRRRGSLLERQPVEMVLLDVSMPKLQLFHLVASFQQGNNIRGALPVEIHTLEGHHLLRAVSADLSLTNWKRGEGRALLGALRYRSGSLSGGC